MSGLLGVEANALGQDVEITIRKARSEKERSYLCARLSTTTLVLLSASARARRVG
jgi:hypothetical protein